MIKKITFTLALGISFIVFGQNKGLNRQFGIDATVLGAGIFYEQPISESVLGEFSAGYGSAFVKDYSIVGGNFGIYMPYSRAVIKAYYNRGKRVEKGKSISHNRGNYIGIQNKIIYGTKEYYHPYMINEIHWGTQTEISNKMLLNFHLGVGYCLSSDKDNNGFIPTLGIRLKYIL